MSVLLDSKDYSEVVRLKNHLLRVTYGPVETRTKHVPPRPVGGEGTLCVTVLTDLPLRSPTGRSKGKKKKTKTSKPKKFFTNQILTVCEHELFDQKSYSLRQSCGINKPEPLVCQRKTEFRRKGPSDGNWGRSFVHFVWFEKERSNSHTYEITEKEVSSLIFLNF